MKLDPGDHSLPYYCIIAVVEYREPDKMAAVCKDSIYTNESKKSQHFSLDSSLFYSSAFSFIVIQQHNKRDFTTITQDAKEKIPSNKIAESFCEIRLLLVSFFFLIHTMIWENKNRVIFHIDTNTTLS